MQALIWSDREQNEMIDAPISDGKDNNLLRLFFVFLFDLLLFNALLVDWRLKYWQTCDENSPMVLDEECSSELMTCLNGGC